MSTRRWGSPRSPRRSIRPPVPRWPIVSKLGSPCSQLPLPRCRKSFGRAASESWRHRIEDVPLPLVAEGLDKWAAAVADINLWTSARTALDTLRDWGFGSLADGLDNGSIAAVEARPIADLQIAAALWRCACADDPDLPRLDGSTRDATVTEFRALDRRRSSRAIRGARQLSRPAANRRDR